MAGTPTGLPDPPPETNGWGGEVLSECAALHLERQPSQAGSFAACLSAVSQAASSVVSSCLQGFLPAAPSCAASSFCPVASAPSCPPLSLPAPVSLDSPRPACGASGPAPVSSDLCAEAAAPPGRAEAHEDAQPSPAVNEDASVGAARPPDSQRPAQPLLAPQPVERKKDERQGTPGDRPPQATDSRATSRAAPKPPVRKTTAFEIITRLDRLDSEELVGSYVGDLQELEVELPEGLSNVYRLAGSRPDACGSFPPKEIPTVEGVIPGDDRKERLRVPMPIEEFRALSPERRLEELTTWEFYTPPLNPDDCRAIKALKAGDTVDAIDAWEDGATLAMMTGEDGCTISRYVLNQEPPVSKILPNTNYWKKLEHEPVADTLRYESILTDLKHPNVEEFGTAYHAQEYRFTEENTIKTVPVVYSTWSRPASKNLIEVLGQRYKSYHKELNRRHTRRPKPFHKLPPLNPGLATKVVEDVVFQVGDICQPLN
eukprot:GHVT01089472.1.p1 GENE.GHVT01089472.1~~GHVT01089472.1.p1  ORF type:complete len:487 (+),score=96.41 GHVT01089472.1:299-1759(+)